jgi:hypothetical protein
VTARADKWAVAPGQVPASAIWDDFSIKLSSPHYLPASPPHFSILVLALIVIVSVIELREMSRQFVEKRFRRFEIRRVEALGESIVDRLERCCRIH